MYAGFVTVIFYFYGYGSVNYKKKGSAILRKTQLSSSKYKVHADEKRVVVDQSAGRGICTGDSGGPGLVEIDGELQILGINSWVDGKGVNEKYTVDGEEVVNICKGKASLVLADSYRDWIEMKLKSRGRSLRP